VKKIAEAVLLYKRDTGLFPGFNYLADARAGTTGTVTANLKECLVTGPSTNTTLTGAWSAGCGTNIGYLEAYMNFNSVGLSSTNLANNTGGMIGYRGPYLDGLSGLDPWGNPYVVNSGNLASTSSNRAFAISAGPNGTLDTAQNTTATPSNTTDDVVSLIK
jgi:hypothetical protein